MSTVPPASGVPSAQTDGLFHLMARVVLRETGTTLALLATLLIALGVLVNSGLGGAGSADAGASGLWHFISHVHLDRNQQPIGPQFWSVLWETLPLIAAACGWLTVLSLFWGTLFALQPRLQVLRWGVIAVSCVPSFMGPLLAFLISPGRPFAGFDQIAAWTWPALCLAVGDLNWLTGTTVVAESLRRELARPHWRLSRALGTSAVADLVPHLVVTVLGFLAARLPHLLGGTIALEALFRIRGIGLWTWNAIIESPPDPTILVWVGGLGIVLSRAMHLLTSVTTLWCFPEQRVHSISVTSQADETPALSELPGESDGAAAEPIVAVVSAQEGSNRVLNLAESVRLIVPVQPAAADVTDVPARPTWWQGLRVRWSYYRQLHSTHRAKCWIAVAVVCLWSLLILGLGAHAWSLDLSANGGVGDAMEQPSWQRPLGTNAAGDDVAWLIWKGWWQQVPAWLACVAMLILFVPLSLIAPRKSSGRTFAGAAAYGTRLIADGLMSLLEATPKLIWLLACFTVFSLDGLVLKLALAMGVLFVPQLDRVLRADLAVVRSSLFLEAMRMARVPKRRILIDNILAGHVWPTLCVQAALILSNVVLTESWLGYLGVRNRGEIFTWGSLMGMGVDEFVQMRPLVAYGQPFNDAVAWGPLLCLWLTICLLTTLGHGLKVLTGSYLWRLK